MSYKFTVAVCHLNMVKTVEESLLSIYNSTNDEFEILVVDDGSTDGSENILARLEDDYDRIRVVEGSNENIAQARNQSVECATGEYILHQLDTDDAYSEGIVDIAHVYERLDEALDRDVYLRGRDIHIARRTLLQRVPYRDVGYGEDLDLWRRMDACPEVEMVWLSHVPIHEKIGYFRSARAYAGVRYSTVKVNFQTGITPTSYVRWMLSELLPGGWRMRGIHGIAFHIMATPVAYVDSLRAGHLDNSELPDEYRDYCWYMTHVMESVRTLSEIETQYGIDFSPDEFSPAGREILFGDSLPAPEQTAP